MLSEHDVSRLLEDLGSTINMIFGGDLRTRQLPVPIAQLLCFAEILFADELSLGALSARDMASLRKIATLPAIPYVLGIRLNVFLYAYLLRKVDLVIKNEHQFDIEFLETTRVAMLALLFSQAVEVHVVAPFVDRAFLDMQKKFQQMGKACVSGTSSSSDRTSELNVASFWEVSSSGDWRSFARGYQRQEICCWRPQNDDIICERNSLLLGHSYICDRIFVKPQRGSAIAVSVAIRSLKGAILLLRVKFSQSVVSLDPVVSISHQESICCEAIRDLDDIVIFLEMLQHNPVDGVKLFVSAEAPLAEFDNVLRTVDLIRIKGNPQVDCGGDDVGE